MSLGVGPTVHLSLGYERQWKVQGIDKCQVCGEGIHEISQVLVVKDNGNREN